MLLVIMLLVCAYACVRVRVIVCVCACDKYHVGDTEDNIRKIGNGGAVQHELSHFLILHFEHIQCQRPKWGT